MEDRIDELLYEEFPDLFQPVHRGLRAEVSVMKGWYPLIRDLCTELYNIEPRVTVLQVKEKFGTLRFYTDISTEEQDSIIRNYENKSSSICEECGEPGTLRTELSWVKTLCEKHAEEKISKRSF